MDPATGHVAGPTIKEQARQALENCRNILRAAGAGLNDVVDVHQLLLNPDDADDFTDVCLTFFQKIPSAMRQQARSQPPWNPDLGQDDGFHRRDVDRIGQQTALPTKTAR